MDSKPPTTLDLQTAKEILNEYSCLQLKTPNTQAEKTRLQQALLLITRHCESENLGICADHASQGFATLSSYLQALGYEVAFGPESIPKLESPVYIKFNTQRMAHFVDTYTGEYRGVLVSCQSEDEAIAGTYGHLPLDLFARVK